MPRASSPFRLFRTALAIAFLSACADGPSGPTAATSRVPILSTSPTAASLVSGFSPGVEVEITREPASENLPDIDGDILVWSEGDGPNRDIVAFDLSTAERIQVTDHEAAATLPAVSGSTIVWMDDRTGRDEIWAFDMTTRTSTQLTTGPTPATTPDVSGRRVVFVRGGDIWMLDLSTGQESVVATGPHATNQSSPAIHGDRIVWRDDRNGEPDIFFIDLNEGVERRLTPLGSTQVKPAVHGDVVAWRDRRNGLDEVFMLDLVTGVETQLTFGGNALEIDVSGNLIVYSDARPGNHEIFVYDIATGVESRVTDYFRDDRWPAVSGDAIVWGRQSTVEQGTSFDIFVNVPADRVPPSFDCLGITQIPVAECQALVALYESTDGDNWDDNTGWLATDTPCGWFGVTCSPDPRSVTRVDLEGNNLSGTLPPELENLTNLSFLSLASDPIVGEIPAELGNLTNLTQLRLSNLPLTGAIPAELGGATGLRQLLIAGTQLTGGLPASFGNFSELINMIVINNPTLGGPLPPEMGSLASLSSLTLANNQHTGSIPAEWGQLANLQTLQLNQNRLSGNLPEELGDLGSLRSLSIRSNQLEGPIPASLGRLEQLRSLILDGNRLTGGLPAELANLGQLTRMDLDRNFLSGQIPSWLGQLTSLRTLSLQFNDFEGAIPPELGSLDLLTLILNNNALSGTIPPELGSLVNLNLFWLNDTALSGRVPLSVAVAGGLVDDTNPENPVQPRCNFQRTDLVLPDAPEYRAADLNLDGRICAIPFTVVNSPPTADPGGPYTANEGDPIVFDGTASSDPDGDALTFAWDFGDGSTGTGSAPTHAFADDGAFTVTLTVTDPGSLSAQATTTATIANLPPSITGLEGPLDPVQVGTAISLAADFTDPGVLDTHSAEIDWGDGTVSAASVSGTGGTGRASGSHAYAAPGVYTIGVTVTDDDGGSDQAFFEFAVVFDPDGGFVTGGGWIDSAPGAHRLDPQATGKAVFGFQSKYRKGAITPSGRTQFRFRAGDLDFTSSSYDWLVVSQAGSTAQFKGSGSVNGLLSPTGEPYRFMIWAGDGDPDTFRIKIWYEDAGEVVVYDNDFDQAVGGGSINVQQN